jgi:hypothetical protein
MSASSPPAPTTSEGWERVETLAKSGARLIALFRAKASLSMPMRSVSVTTITWPSGLDREVMKPR